MPNRARGRPAGSGPSGRPVRRGEHCHAGSARQHARFRAGPPHLRCPGPPGLVHEQDRGWYLTDAGSATLAARDARQDGPGAR